MSKIYKTALLRGSLRKNSYGSKLANLIKDLSSSFLALKDLELSDLPFYNEDFEETPPKAWLRFRKEIRDCDAVLCLTPEYNRLLPAHIKNALDVGSRPQEKSVWQQKPAAIITYSPGMLGGAFCNAGLRQSMNVCGLKTMIAPEAYYGLIGNAFDEHGNACLSMQTRLKNFLQAFKGLIQE